jgi:hypothetical protein
VLTEHAHGFGRRLHRAERIRLQLCLRKHDEDVRDGHNRGPHRRQAAGRRSRRLCCLAEHEQALGHSEEEHQVWLVASKRAQGVVVRSRRREVRERAVRVSAAEQGECRERFRQRERVPHGRLIGTGVRARCDLDTATQWGQAFTYTIWALQALIWALAALAIAAYTGLIRKPT